MTQDEAYTVTDYATQTGTETTRTITPLPVPQRLTKPTPLTLAEIKESLIETGNSIDVAQSQYKVDTESLDAFYAERKSLIVEIAELQAQLREKQDRLAELDNRGTPRDIFAASIVSLERQVTAYSGHLLVTLREQSSQRIYGISFDELSADGQRDAMARYRKLLGRFTSPSYVSLGRSFDKASADQINRRADQLLDDVEQLLTSKDFFPQE
jgi:hypothetical protein